MATWQIERLGGLANFGGPRSRIRSVGKLESNDLSSSDQEALEALFRKPPRKAPKRQGIPADGFRYRITRTTPEGSATIEIPESLAPAAVAACVKDELA